MSIGKIYAAMAKVNAELKAIGKDQEGYGYKFRGIDDVFFSLNPLFKKYGIITTRSNVVLDRNVREVTDKYGKQKNFVEVFLQADYDFVSLEDGSSITTTGFGEGQDTSGGDKASSMATSNAYKYVIFEMFNIASQEQQDSDQVTAKQNKGKGATGAAKKEAKPEVEKKKSPFRTKNKASANVATAGHDI
jgi:hypothetical protein